MQISRPAKNKWRSAVNRGVLFANTGSPLSSSENDVREYIRTFLMDEHIVDIPYPLRWFLVNKIILKKRVPKVAARYRQLETKQGFPLNYFSENLAKHVRQQTFFPVELGMSYSEPSFRQALEKLKNKGVAEVLVIPMFPQFAYPTYSSIIDSLKKVAYQVSANWQVYIKIPFFQDPHYIALLAEHVAHYTMPHHHLLFSFHSVPLSHLQKVNQKLCNETDCTKPDCFNEPSCYQKQVEKTVSLLTQKLHHKNFTLAYQSRIGGRKWLSPFTDHEIIRIAKEDKSLRVIAPGFLIDNLETLEELVVRGKDAFLKNGGSDYEVLPCLNDSKALSQLISEWVTSEDLFSLFNPLLRKT